jgi:hypothetical protein
MRSIWGLYKSARDNDDDNTAISSKGQASSLDALATKVGSHGGVLVGSNDMRISNVASPPAAIPTAGTVLWSTTSKVAMFSDGTSMFTAEGSLMG